MSTTQSIPATLKQSANLKRLSSLLAEQKFESRSAVVKRVCHEFGFHDESGRLRTSSCQAVLSELEQLGQVVLPAPSTRPPRNSGRPRGLEQPVPAPSAVPRQIEQIENLRLVRVDTAEQRYTWNEIIKHEHPRGATIHAGAQMRYLIVSEHGFLGALGFSSPALRVAARDRWIGWDEKHRSERLNQAVINLSRFLIRSMVNCHNLGSHVLGQCLRRLPADFKDRYGFRPWLVETFVDTETHSGTVFAAAGFVHAGETTGRGRFARNGTERGSTKSVWIRPLCRRWWQQLGAPEPQPEPVLEPGEGLERQYWAENELGGAPLGDQRSSARLVSSAQIMAEQPGAPFATAAKGNSSLIAGYYRLIEQPADSNVTTQNILTPHYKRTRQRSTGCAIVLLVQNGTDLNFAIHDNSVNFGLISHNRKETKGTINLHLHTTMAVNAANGLPLGIARIAFDNWDSKARKNKLPEKRKSAHCLQGLRDIAAQAQPGVRHLSVMDLEADFFELFAEAKRLRKVDLLVGAKVNCQLTDDETKLFEQLATQPVKGCIEIDLPRSLTPIATSTQKAKPLWEARLAQSKVRWIKHEFPLTNEPHRKTQVRLTLFSICETDPPAGIQPLYWQLLTSLPVNSMNDVEKVVNMYRLRRRIEDWYHILKTNCNVEQLKHKQAERIERVVAIKAVIAWRLQLITALGHEPSEL